MDRLIHTPEGVRDVYNQECTKKLYLENQIEQVFHAFGYQDIETPTFEFFDVFGREVGTTPSRELYKFFDRDGNTLVLRPDFTPSIARAASWKRRCRSAFATEEAASSTAAAIRAA